MTTILQQQTIAAMPGNWSATLPFNQFDPATGKLQNAIFTAAGTVDASAMIENLAPFAATVNLGVAGAIAASAPGVVTLGAIDPFAVASVKLAPLPGPFDGTVDFLGPSGTILPDLSGSATQTAVVNFGTGPGGSPLLGTGTFDVNVTSTATSTVEGNGNLAVLLHGSTGATVSLRYEATQPVQYGGGYAAGFTSAIEIGIPFWQWFANTVTTTPQTVTFASQTSGWNSTASFDRFDPSLGTLEAVYIRIDNTTTGTFAAENLEAAPATVSMVENASMTVVTPGDAAGVTTTVEGDDGYGLSDRTFSLGAYDGASDFGGGSGQAASYFDRSDWHRDPLLPGVALTDAADLNAFTGTGTITVPVATVGTSVVTGPANLFTEMTQQTGGTVSVRYVYAPATTGEGGGASSGLVDFSNLGTAVASGGTVGSFAMAAPRMTFLGAIGTNYWAGGTSGETFLIAAGATASIYGFSLTTGETESSWGPTLAVANCLNLTDVLAGAPLAHDLSNLGSFLSVTGQSPGYFNDWNTTLVAQGPGGAASLVLENANKMSVLDLLNANVLVLPAH